ncbi:MAG: rod shape-determining protein RodA [Candidatus Competibacteraceae bacterium]|nr:rod shape-determining protein RodA [Candidatus Competibacteraceae bacterium]
MTSRKQQIIGNVDWWLLLGYLLLVFFGWINIYSASYSETHTSIFDMSAEQGKQFVWICISLGMGLFLLLFDARIYHVLSFIIYGLVMVGLVLVLLFGQTVAGNKSWFVITSSIKIQPSEFAKFATALVMGRIMSDPKFSFSPGTSLANRFHIGPLSFNISKNGMWAIIFVLIPAILILLENDTGTTLVFLSFFLAFFRFGFNWLFLITGVLSVIIFFSTILYPIYYVLACLAFIGGIALLFTRQLLGGWKVWLLMMVFFTGFTLTVKPIYDKVLKEHHRKRIMVLLGQEKDMKGSGWNVNNSKMAIGSGGVAGKGFLKGTLTKLKFVPKQHTDFIFSTVGEEWGFIGSTALVLLYLFFIMRLIWVSERQRSMFSKVYGYCLACIFFFHFFMNIGTAIGMAPAVGIPLPLVSYGGSSLLGFTLLIFVFLKFDSQNMHILR